MRRPAPSIPVKSVFNYTDEAIQRIVSEHRDLFPDGLGLKFKRPQGLGDSLLLSQCAIEQRFLGECFFDSAMLSILINNPYLVRDMIVVEDKAAMTVTLRAFLPDGPVTYKAHYFELSTTDITTKHGLVDFHKHTQSMAIIEKLFAVVKLHYDTQLPAHLHKRRSIRTFKDYLHYGLSYEVFQILLGVPVIKRNFATDNETTKAVFRGEMHKRAFARKGLAADSMLLLLESYTGCLLFLIEKVEVDESYSLSEEEVQELLARNFFSQAELTTLIDDREALLKNIVAGFATGDDIEAERDAIAEYLHGCTEFFAGQQGQKPELPRLRSRMMQELLTPAEDVRASRSLRMTLVPDSQPGVCAGKKYQDPEREIYLEIREHLQQGNPVTASTEGSFPQSATFMPGFDKVYKGLAAMHAYSLFHIERRVNARGEETYLLYLKNPWQRFGFTYIESDDGGQVRDVYMTRSSDYDGYDELTAAMQQTFGASDAESIKFAQKPETSLNGVTVIELKDFLKFFDNYTICPVASANHHVLHRLRTILLNIRPLLASGSAYAGTIVAALEAIRAASKQLPAAEGAAKHPDPAAAALPESLERFFRELPTILMKPAEVAGSVDPWVEDVLRQFCERLLARGVDDNPAGYVEALVDDLDQAIPTDDTLLAQIAALADKKKFTNIAAILGCDMPVTEKFTQAYFFLSGCPDHKDPLQQFVLGHLVRYPEKKKFAEGELSAELAKMQADIARYSEFAVDIARLSKRDKKAVSHRLHTDLDIEAQIATAQALLPAEAAAVADDPVAASLSVMSGQAESELAHAAEGEDFDRAVGAGLSHALLAAEADDHLLASSFSEMPGLEELELLCAAADTTLFTPVALSSVEEDSQLGATPPTLLPPPTNAISGVSCLAQASVLCMFASVIIAMHPAGLVPAVIVGVVGLALAIGLLIYTARNSSGDSGKTNLRAMSVLSSPAAKAGSPADSPAPS